jgi:hypothetical protein
VRNPVDGGDSALVTPIYARHRRGLLIVNAQSCRSTLGRRHPDCLTRILETTGAIGEQGAGSETGAMDTEATVIVVPEPGAAGQEADYP